MKRRSKTSRLKEWLIQARSHGTLKTAPEVAAMFALHQSHVSTAACELGIRLPRKVRLGAFVTPSGGLAVPRWAVRQAKWGPKTRVEFDVSYDRVVVRRV